MKERLERAVRELGADGAALYRLDPPARLARLVAWVGEEPRETVPFGLTPIGECAATGKALSREVRGTRPGKYHSHVILPLFRGGTRWGVLSFSSIREGHFETPALRDRARSLASGWDLSGSD